MVSGAELFFSLFNNLAIFIALVSIHGFLISHFPKTESYGRQTAIGLSFGLFAIGCMYAKIPVYEGVIVDQRNAIVALSGLYGGPLAAVICAAIAGTFRYYLGGAGVLAGVFGVCLAAVAGIILRTLFGKFDKIPKAFFGSLLAVVIILPGFLVVGDLQTGWNLMMAMALPYGTAVFVGIFLTGLLLNRQEYLHEVENEFRQSEAHLRTLIETIPDLVWLKNPEGIYLACNLRFERFFGAKQADIVGKTDYDFVDAKLADFFREKDKAAMAARKPTLNEEEITYADDGHSEVLETIKTPMFDRAGNLIGVLGVARDITDRKRMEGELAQAHKMEAMGTLAGGIAHDFNNILAAILGYADLAMDETPDASPAKFDIGEIIKAANRAKELVSHILSFSRKETQGRIPVQIALICQEALKLLRASIPTTIKIEQQIDLACGNILADPTQIHQVLMNLCTNAAQAMDADGGVMQVEVISTELHAGDLPDEPELKPGHYVRLSVKDSGVGINPQYIDRIFDPYFTTKEAGKGSGMGLAVVMGIVKSHEGIITVDTNPGEGTQFNLYFPRIDEQIQGEQEDTEPLPTGVENILVVDDEEGLVDMMTRRVEQLGYRVTATSSSVEALELFAAQPDTFDLVLTDQTMPLLTGENLAKKILALRPDIPIIICSGHSSKMDAEKARLYGISAFIMKPVDQKKLAGTIRQALDKEL